MTGIMAGTIGLLAALPLLWLSGALESLGRSSGLALWAVMAAYLPLMAGAGAVYGRIFMRAANDVRGGWLFGISYGFLLWMLGPITVMQWTLGKPLAVGSAAQGLFAGHLAYGLVLGALFPWCHRLIQKRLQ